jgi:hypothetical protein
VNLTYNWNQQALDRLRQDRASGLSFREIEKLWNNDATRRGVTRSSVAGKCAALGLPSPTQAQGGYAARQGGYLDHSRDDELRALWTKLTMPGLAAHFRIPETTVRTWGRRLRMPARTLYLPPMRKECPPVVVAKKQSKPLPPVTLPKPKIPVAAPLMEDEPYTAARSQRKCQWVTQSKPRVRMCSSFVAELGSPWCGFHQGLCYTNAVPHSPINWNGS